MSWAWRIVHLGTSIMKSQIAPIIPSVALNALQHDIAFRVDRTNQAAKVVYWVTPLTNTG